MNSGEIAGRAQRFTSAFVTHRNPRAHSEPSQEPFASVLREFLAVNELYFLEAAAVSSADATESTKHDRESDTAT